jgi:uncharacterized protein involved in type VI secretion and phage assembly
VKSLINIADEKGLFLFVTSSGAKSWRFKYRYGGKEKLLSIQQHNNTTTQQHNNTTTQQHNNTTTQQHSLIFINHYPTIVVIIVMRIL